MGIESLTLPPEVRKILAECCESAPRVLGPVLSSIVLFGSAAEGRLRKSSDVNVIFVLKSFDARQMTELTPFLQMAHAAVRLEVMFLLEGEIETAAELFAVKFFDIAHRRAVLFGADPFEKLSPSPSAIITRVRQVLLNLLLRLRASAALHGNEQPELIRVIAESASPLRASAQALLQLRGRSLPPREALEQLAEEVGGGRHGKVVAALPEARQTLQLEGKEAVLVLADLIVLTSDLKGLAKEFNLA